MQHTVFSIIVRVMFYSFILVNKVSKLFRKTELLHFSDFVNEVTEEI